MSLLWQTIRAAEKIMTRTIGLGMAFRGTTTLLTKPVILLRVTVLVVIFPVVEDTHLGGTTRPRLVLPLIPVFRKGEPIGALSRIEGTWEEDIGKHYE